MGHFLYRFSTFCEKVKKIYPVEVWIFCKTLHRTPFIWLLRLAVRQFQMPLQGLRFVKMMAIFEIISATDSLMQNVIRIVCLCWLTFDIFNLRALIYQNQTSIPLLISETKPVTPKFYFISETSKSLSVRSRSLKKSFAGTSLNKGHAQFNSRPRR